VEEQNSATPIRPLAPLRVPVATTVTVSYPASLGDWERDQLRTDHLRAYLKRANDRAREGDTWSVAVNAGCAGLSPNITLHVEAVDGERALDESIELAFVERDGGATERDEHREPSPKN